MSNFSRRTFLLGASAFAAAPKRPNIVVMMADDMGFSDLGCYGSEIATPNLDRLARNGLRFTQFYNNARCCPTRASLLTGLYPHQAAIGHMVQDYGVPGYRGDLTAESVTIAEALGAAGYRTAMSGKWHVSRESALEKDDKHNWPLQRGFEKYFGTIIGAGNYFDPAHLIRDNQPIQAPRNAGFYYTNAIADNAVDFIGGYAKGPAPFFLYVAFTSPHWPLHALDEDIAKYKDRYKSGWDALRHERHKRQIATGVVDKKWELTPRDSAMPKWDGAPDKEWESRRMAVYAAQIDRMDQNVGRIVKKLEQEGALDNTLILFLADNGGCAEVLGANVTGFHVPKQTREGKAIRLGNDTALMPGDEMGYQSYGPAWANASNTPFRMYKHWVHEGGISSPLIAHWPAGFKQKNTFTNQPGHLVDLMATCVDAAGAEYPRTYKGRTIKPLEGRSLVPVMQGKKRPVQAIYWEHEGNRAVRQGKWKLVAKHKEAWELYNMEADRSEMHNLAAAQPARVKELGAMWDAWAARSNVMDWDKLPRPGRRA